MKMSMSTHNSVWIKLLDIIPDIWSSFVWLRARDFGYSNLFVAFYIIYRWETLGVSWIS